MLKEITICGLENPLGLDECPRFSWKITSGRNDVVQTSYRITVNDGAHTVWDSGTVESAQSIHVLYGGESPAPFTKYLVHAAVCDNHGELHEASASFETGLMAEENLKGIWITHTLPPEETAPAVFCREIELGNRPIKSVRIYAAACGVYDIIINGKKLGDACFSPGWTSYHHRIQYQTYDATEQFAAAAAEGAVHMEVPVANGWYAGYLNVDDAKNHYGDRTALRLMVRIVYEDGSVQVIGTDESWSVKTGVIRYAEIYHGEEQDFTFCDTACTPAAVFRASDSVGALVPQISQSVRVTQRIPAAALLRTPAGETVIDFGQNMAGYVEVCLPPLSEGAKTAKLVIRHAETLDRYGNFYTENLRSARATDTYRYTAEQAGKTVHPHFTYHGFRYIAVEAENCEVRQENFTALVLHSDMKRTGTFACDNEKINRLHENILWGMNSNFFDIPTDCPQRDERLGWTGDAQIFCATAAYLCDTELFYHKWLADVALESNPENGVPHLVPDIVGNSAGTSVWGDCAAVIPWQVYESYGDAELLRQNYPLMKLWVQYIRSQCGGDVLWLHGFQRGDWLALDAPACRPGIMYGGTDRNLVANVYYALSVRLTAQAAEVIGEEADSREYQALYERIRDELNEEFVTKRGRLVTETQTACVLLLHFDLLKEEYRGRVMQTLRANLTDNRNHLTTGFVGTAFLCHALTENGMHDLAEKILLQEDYPSWLYQVNKGATTIWERWNSIAEDGTFDQSGMNSRNHYSYGAVGDWMYRKIAGINPLKPGYKEILLKPYLTHGMTQVSASLETPYGLLCMNWSCRGGQITVDVTIPANATARLVLPERDGEIRLGSGTYHYCYPTDTVLAVGRFSDDTVVGEILGEEAAAEIFYEIMPQMKDNPMMGYISRQTVGALKGMSAEMAPVFDEVIRRLNAAEI